MSRILAGILVLLMIIMIQSLCIQYCINHLIGVGVVSLGIDQVSLGSCILMRVLPLFFRVNVTTKRRGNQEDRSVQDAIEILKVLSVVAPKANDEKPNDVRYEEK